MGEFWAVDDVSFELKQGETLGIIGANGSGKSTLLKMLNGIFMPDKGRIEINGRVGALIEVGAGFHPMLTGRENIYVNGAVMGMTRAEIDEKFQEIIDFADIGDFIDAPVKHYSSGMFVRLGFSVAIHSQPDILLVDEVLAVGDMDFMLKSSNYMLGMLDKASVVLVSHNLAHIRRLCTRVIVMDKSKPVFIGDPNEAVTFYMSQLQKQVDPERSQAQTLEPILVQGVDAYPCTIEGRRKEGNLRFNEDFAIELDLDFGSKVERPEFRVSLNLPESNVLVASASTLNSGKIPESVSGPVRVKFHFKKPILFPRQYYVNIAVCDEQMGVYYLAQTDVMRLNIDYVEARFSDMEAGLGVTCLEKDIDFQVLNTND